MATFRPSEKPDSLRPLRNAASQDALVSGVPEYRYPITGIADCCAPAASGHAAALPSAPAKCRRVTVISTNPAKTLPR
jgi:hypothetical protein